MSEPEDGHRALLLKYSSREKGSSNVPMTCMAFLPRRTGRGVESLLVNFNVYSMEMLRSEVACLAISNNPNT
ncbi:MAG: hypothetical protein ACK53Y_23720, partial [bacterium]